MRSDGEGELDVHARGIALHGRVDELCDLGEFHDLVKFLIDFGAGHTKDCAVHVHILAAGEFRVEARADLQHGGDTTVHGYFAGRRRGNAGEELQERGFAGAVVSDDSDGLALSDLNIDIVQRQKPVADIHVLI